MVIQVQLPVKWTVPSLSNEITILKPATVVNTPFGQFERSQ